MSKGLNHWHMTWQFTSGTAPFTWLGISARGTLQTLMLTLSMSALGGKSDIPDRRFSLR
jgi:hypothetical protein